MEHLQAPAHEASAPRAVQQVDYLIQTSQATASSKLLTLSAFVVVIVGLYFGRQVLIPLALAVVFAFLLTPVVGWLERCRLGRVPAVLIVLVLAFLLAGFIGWMVSGQLMNVVDQFPELQIQHPQQASGTSSSGRQPFAECREHCHGAKW